MQKLKERFDNVQNLVVKARCHKICFTEHPRLKTAIKQKLPKSLSPQSSHRGWWMGVKSKVGNLGDQKAPFSIATTLRSRGGCYFIPWIAPLYPRSLPNNVEC